MRSQCLPETPSAAQKQLRCRARISHIFTDWLGQEPYDVFIYSEVTFFNLPPPQLLFLAHFKQKDLQIFSAFSVLTLFFNPVLTIVVLSL